MAEHNEFGKEGEEEAAAYLIDKGYSIRHRNWHCGKKELDIVAHQLAPFNEYVAIGEIGLDLYWDKTYLKEQQIAFERQVRWALEYGLPVVIHCREAFDYIYDILKPYKTSSLRGIFHSFTGTREEAFRMLEFSNFFIGINARYLKYQSLYRFHKVRPCLLSFINLRNIFSQRIRNRHQQENL